jgi:arylsulfatase A-like enzyme
MRFPHPLISLLVLAAFPATLALVSGSGAAQSPPTRPNILLVLADDMGYSDLGCYGGEIATPNLDRLARDGVRFTQAYNTAKCFPSRACLLTGLYAQQVGMARGPGSIRNAVTLGEVLRSAGYRTLMVGKHHGKQNPHDRGFDRYFGLRDGACNYFNPGKPRTGEPKPAQKRNNRAWCIDDVTHQPYTPQEKDFYTTDYFTKYALQYLDEYADEDRPFFLYMSFNAPHDPLQAWPDDIAKYKGKYDAGYEAIRSARYARQRKMGLFRANAPKSGKDHADWDTLSAEAKRTEARRMEVYAAMIDRLDQNIGKVLAKLRGQGKLDNTLILFASDNGCSSEVVRRGDGEIGAIDRWASLKRDWANVSNTPFRRYKNHSHEGGICTPLIVHWPAVIKNQNRFARTPVHFIDLMATFVDLGRANYPKVFGGEKISPMQGVSLAPLFRGETLQRRRPLFWQWGRGRAIRDGNWKLVTHGKSWQLYDMDADRTEMHNLADAHPDRVTAMTLAWESWYRATPAGKRRRK